MIKLSCARRMGLAALGATVGVLGFSSSALGAVAGGANTPPASVAYPQVTSATVTQRGASLGATQPLVTACFNTGVQAPGGGAFTAAQAASFTLNGFNVNDSLAATGVAPATGTGMQNCLVLSFASASAGGPSAYVQGFTVLDVAQGALASTNAGNPTNPPEAAQLDGSDFIATPTEANTINTGNDGENSGPLIRETKVNAQGNGGRGTVVYDFDKAIPCPGDPGNRGRPPTAAGFGFYTATSATPFVATTIVLCSATGSPTQRGEVTVGFAVGAPVSFAVREYVTFGAVGTLDHPANGSAGAGSLAATQQPASGGGGPANQGASAPSNPPVPYLVGARQMASGSDQFGIFYNEPVNAGANLGGGGPGTPLTAGNICAQLSDGSQTCATSATSDPNAVLDETPNVTVTFPHAASFSEKIVSVSDNGGAVRDRSQTPAGGNASAVASDVIQNLALAAPGYVDSDSLHQCTVDTQNSTVSYQFVGANIAPTTQMGAVDTSGFNLLDTNGSRVGPASSATLQSDSHTVVAQFQPRQVAAGVACEVNGNLGGGTFGNANAVLDGSGKANARNTIGIGTASTRTPGFNLNGYGGDPGARSSPGSHGGGGGSQSPPPSAGGGSQILPPGGGSGNPGTVRRKSAPRVAVHAAKRKRGRFTRFHISGKLTLPAGVTRDQACKGDVAVTIRHGTRTVAHRTLGVRANCTYSTFITIMSRRLRGRRSHRVIVRFAGNNYLLSSSARQRRV